MATLPEYPGAWSSVRNGKTVWRYRANRHAKTTTLPGLPGEEAFDTVYQRCVKGMGEIADVIGLPTAAAAESFGKAARLLEKTIEWLDYDPQTRDKNTRLIERFLEKRVDEEYPVTWRETPVRFMTAKLLRTYIQSIYTTNPTVAKHMLVAIRKLLRVAIDEEWIAEEDDPALSLRVRVKTRPDANKPWPRSVQEQFEAKHAPGTAARTCYELALWLGNRRGDVAALEWDQLVVEEIEIDNEFIEIEAFDFRQRKNRNTNGGREMFIPVIDRLAKALAPLDRTKGGTVLKTAYGNPFSEKSLTGSMANWTKQAGLPKGYTIHGLRKSFGNYLGESDIQARAIMDAMGHSSMAVTDIYVRDANKKRMAVSIAQTINTREEKRDRMKRRGILRIVS